MKRVVSNFLVLASVSFAIEVFSTELPRILSLKMIEVDISLDGFVDEPIWQSIPIVDDMKISDPDTLVDAPYKTDIRFFYTESGIYFSMINHQPEDSLVARMTSRDSFLEIRFDKSLYRCFRRGSLWLWLWLEFRRCDVRYINSSGAEV